MFMGLKTFSLMMLVFNMAFLTASETDWILKLLPDPQGSRERGEPPSGVVAAAESTPIAVA